MIDVHFDAALLHCGTHCESFLQPLIYASLMSRPDNQIYSAMRGHSLQTQRCAFVQISLIDSQRQLQRLFMLCVPFFVGHQVRTPHLSNLE